MGLQFYQFGPKVWHLCFVCSETPRQPGKSCIDSIEEILFVPSLVVAGQYRINQLVESEVRTSVYRPSSGTLRELMAQSFHGELEVRHPEQGIPFASSQLDGVIFGRTLIAAEGADVVDIEFLGLPRQEAFGICCGNCLGSAAARNASRVNIPEA